MADAVPDAQAAQQIKGQLNDKAAGFGITTIQDMSNDADPARAVRLLESIPAMIRVRVMRMPEPPLPGATSPKAWECRAIPQPSSVSRVPSGCWTGCRFENTLDPRGSHKDWHGQELMNWCAPCR